MSNQKMEPFESRLSESWHPDHAGVHLLPSHNGPRAIVIPLPEDYEGPGLGEECEFQPTGTGPWCKGYISPEVRADDGSIRLRVSGKGGLWWVPLDRIRHPQPKTVEIDGKSYPADDVQRALECCGVEPMEET